MSPMSAEFLRYCVHVFIIVLIAAGTIAEVNRRLQRPAEQTILSWLTLYVVVFFCSIGANLLVLYIADILTR